MIAPDRIFVIDRAQDGFMNLAVGGDMRARVCRTPGIPEFSHDARFAENAARVEHRAEMDRFGHTPADIDARAQAGVIEVVK